MPNPLSVFGRLGLSESETAIYLALVENGQMTASEVTKTTRSKRPTAYYALRQLQDRGLVHRSGSPGVEKFQAERPEKLLNLVEMKRQELGSLEKEVRSVIPSIVRSESPHEGLPAVSFYEGDSAVKQALMETVYCRSGRIDYITPHDNFFWQVGQPFSAAYVRDRVAHGIRTRHLWEKPLDAKIIRESYAELADLKLIPESMRGRFRTAVLIYDDKVLYVASRKSGYALLVRSREHNELMGAIFEQLWNVSKSIAVK